MYKKIIENEKMRFFIVGSGASLVHLILAESMIALNFNLSIFIVNLISFILAFLFSYAGHRFFTFAQEGSVLKFLITAILGFSINNIILNLSVMFGVNERIAIFTAIITVPIITFLLSKYWAFKLVAK